MKTFKQYLREARSHPKLNKKVSAVDVLLKYVNIPDIFVSFRDTMGDENEYHKIGINPNSGYNTTPNGIYTYPLSEFKEAIEAVKKENDKDMKHAFPFASKRKYMFILKVKPKYKDKLLYFDNYVKVDFNEDIKKLIKILDRRVKEQYGGWNNTKYRSAQDLVEQSKSLFIETDEGEGVPSFVIWRTIRNVAEVLVDLKHKIKKLTQTENLNVIQTFNNILREIGYEGAVDYGTGTIHKNEPEQAVFFSIKPIEVLEVIENKNYLDSEVALGQYIKDAIAVESEQSREYLKKMFIKNPKLLEQKITKRYNYGGKQTYTIIEVVIAENRWDLVEFFLSNHLIKDINNIPLGEGKYGLSLIQMLSESVDKRMRTNKMSTYKEKQFFAVYDELLQYPNLYPTDEDMNAVARILSKFPDNQKLENFYYNLKSLQK